jgi:transcription elongation factor
MDTSKLFKVGLIVAGAAGVGYFIYKKFIVKPVASKSAGSVTPSALSTSSAAKSGSVTPSGLSTEELAILNSPTTAQAQSIIDKIKGTPDWYASIVTKAKNNNISIDQQLKLDAVWVINHP